MTIQQALLAPIFLHVLLVYAVLVTLARKRVAAARKGEVKVSEIALNSAAWPDYIKKLANNFDNQFQMPMLWYACCGLLLVTGKADWVAVWLSWAFLLARVIHTLIHIGPNVVIRRFQVFLLGNLVLGALWAWFAFKMYLAA